MIGSSFVVSHDKYFVVEINVEENHKLLNNLCQKLFTKMIRSGRVEEKVGKHGYKFGNLFVTFQVYKKWKKPTKDWNI